MKNNTRFSICLLFLWMSMNFCLAAETYSQETFFTIESNNLTVKEVFNKIVPLETVINDSRKIENLHNLIKNNGNNFDISENEKKLAEIL